MGGNKEGITLKCLFRRLKHSETCRSNKFIPLMDQNTPYLSQVDILSSPLALSVPT